MNLSKHLDMLWMREAFVRINRRSAPGVDGEDVEAFAANLEENLSQLLEQAKAGSYRAPLVLRKHIPKNETETRPIGIPTTANKVLERAVVMLLEPIYEKEFIETSYGFRRKRSAHQALEVIWHWLMKHGGGWVLDVDVSRYFDTIQHGHLREILRKRVKDGVVLRLIDKWLKAGVWENGQISYRDEGSPQGGVISPMLSNIYLNEVLDQWFMREVRPRLRGEALLVRFADDFVILLSDPTDASELKELLPERFGQYGLTIHPEKTKLVDFRRPVPSDKADTFDFLGFTHYWGKTRKGGTAVKRKTCAKKMRKALGAIDDWCKKNRHRPLKRQHEKLCQKIQGHYAFYAITGNSRALGEFFDQARQCWRKWLSRRSSKKAMTWERYNALIHGPYRLPPPRIIHYPKAQGTFIF